ncbi:MAG: spermidine/putrescine ABC transporter permease PotB, partial [Clostridiales bacterium]|nr:spermidine/putrescine ABC transporter permease PotB [Clostridiales bacterium]
MKQKNRAWPLLVPIYLFTMVFVFFPILYMIALSF